MIDVNAQIREILKNVPSVAVTFHSPNKANKLPVISYYELATVTGLCYDNREQGQKSSVQIDIFAKSGSECSKIAIEVDKLMQNEGWYRELSMDIPPEENVYHKTMRFSKNIYFTEE